MELENYLFFILYSDDYEIAIKRGKEDIIAVIEAISLEESADIVQALENEFHSHRRGIYFQAIPEWHSQQNMGQHLNLLRNVERIQSQLQSQCEPKEDLCHQVAQSAIFYAKEIVKQRPRLFIDYNLNELINIFSLILENWRDSRKGPPPDSVLLDMEIGEHKVSFIEHWLKANISVDYADDFHINLYSPSKYLDDLNFRANQILEKDFKGEMCEVPYADNSYHQAILFLTGEYLKDKNPLWMDLLAELNNLYEVAEQKFLQAIEYLKNTKQIVKLKMLSSEKEDWNRRISYDVVSIPQKDDLNCTSDIRASKQWKFSPGKVIVNGIEIQLQGIKFKLLKALHDTNQSLSEQELIEAGWGHDQEVESKTIQNHLTEIRNLLSKKLGLNQDLNPIPCVDVCENRAWKLADDLK